MARFLLDKNQIQLSDGAIAWQLLFFNDETGKIERFNANEMFVRTPPQQPTEVKDVTE